MGEPKEKNAEAAPAASGGGGKMIMIAVGASLISVIAALAVFYFAFMPKLASQRMARTAKTRKWLKPAPKEAAMEAAKAERPNFPSNSTIPP